MKKKIENPKVFISYAWGTDEYQNKVLAFASDLVGEGIDVVLDKWDLSEGNDTYVFMEKCVTDSTITNVLILLDPLYAKKADEHSGGVGTETQIISAKVYSEVEQNKFIPIVMERDVDGSVCKPTYLQTKLHFDLSLSEKYDNEYKRLIKKLYGIEVYEKPQLGKKPAWVEQPMSVPTKKIVTYDVLRNTSMVQSVKKAQYCDFLQEISKQIVDFAERNTKTNVEGIEYIELYDSINALKNDYFCLLGNMLYVDESYKLIADYFEDTTNNLKNANGDGREIAKVLLHELFIYTIAYYMRKKDYIAIGYILGRTYYDLNSYNGLQESSFHMFYSGSAHAYLSQAISDRDDKRYHSGTAEHWIQNINTEIVTKEQFVLADLICFNYSLYGKDYVSDREWFPMTYVYENEFSSSLRLVAKKMSSKEYLNEMLILFGYEDLEPFIEKYKSVEGMRQIISNSYRYSGAWHSAPVLGDYIKIEDIGKMK